MTDRTRVRFDSYPLRGAVPQGSARSCAARASTTSRTSTSRSRATGSSSSPACPAAASRSLAFDTIYAEGQRRYVESLSAYARQFLGQMEKPDVDQIDGLSPAISIDQKGASRNPRSTVGTVTEIYDHLRLLFARIGIPHCPNGHADRAPDRPADRRPGPRPARGHPAARPRRRSSRTARPRATGSSTAPGGRASSASGSTARWYDIAEAPKLDKYKRHSIEVVVDRYIVRHAEAPEGAQRAAGRPADRPGDRLGHPGPGRRPAGRFGRDRAPARARASSSSRRRRADGDEPPFEERRYSEKYSCPYDGFTIDELEPRSFSFNSPHGACPACTGLGTQARDRPGPRHPGPVEEPGRQGALVPWAKMPTDASWRLKILEAICRVRTAGSFNAPVRDLPPEAIEYVLYAAKDEKVVVRYRHERGENTYKATFEGVVTNLERRYRGDRLGVRQDRAREVHGHPALPDLRRQAAAAGDPGGDHRRPEHLGRLDDVDHRRAATGRPALRGILTERERTIAHQVLKEIARPARLPRRRRARLPDPRPDERDAVGRRGPADPPRDPDRDDADGRPVHPRRAVDRAPPARQRRSSSRR